MAERQPPTNDELAQLFQDHREGLAGAVRGVLGGRADVQEVIQDAYLKALRSLRAGTEPREPVAWVFVVVLNLAKDLRRKQVRRQPSLPLEDVSAMELSTTTPPGRGLEHQEALDAARTAIEELRDAEKEVFLLRVSGGLTFGAIGDALGIPTGTAKTRMRSALLRLRGHLASYTPAYQSRRETA
ncbi:MAG: RNA polymerase subunit sigma [Planctomycetes bacterium]|jgi:RNA polymerase sigma-70 factor (ECF subfamily)|nr:RNA polymerase subunit sigma [Planctomycetota bacterium]